MKKRISLKCRQYLQLALVALVGVITSIAAQRYIDSIISEQQKLSYNSMLTHFEVVIQDEVKLKTAFIHNFIALLDLNSTVVGRQTLREVLEKSLTDNTLVKGIKLVAIANDVSNDFNIRDVIEYSNTDNIFQRFSSIEKRALFVDRDFVSVPWLIYPQKNIGVVASTTYVFAVIPLEINESDRKLKARLIVAMDLVTLLEKHMQESDISWTDISIYYPHDDSQVLLSRHTVKRMAALPASQHPSESDGRFDVYHEAAVNFLGTSLSLLYRPGNHDFFFPFGAAHLVPAFLGILLTLLIVAYQSTLIRRNIEVQRAVDVQTKHLLESQKEIEQIINSIDGVLWKYDVNRQEFTFISLQVVDMLGVSKENLLENAKTFFDLIHPDDRQMVEDAQRVLQTSKNITRNIEFRMCRPVGDEIWVRNIISSITEDDVLTHNTGVMMDISEFKKLGEERQMMEVQLRQAQKLEAIGQLAAGVAHEINTPTQFVNDNMHFLQGAFKDLDALIEKQHQFLALIPEDESLQEDRQRLVKLEDEIDIEFLMDEIPACIDQSIDGLKRVSSIVKAMKDFSHPGSSIKEATDINSAIQSTMTVARNEWKYVADIELDLDENMPLVKVLPGEFNQVILNMIVNSSHAIAAKFKDSGEKGKITIRTREHDGVAEICLQDNGCGIPEEYLNKVFDPFFTTKEVGKGTGQGLAIAYSVIVDKHQGKLEVESTQGEGTIFTITIPLGFEEA